LLNIIKSSVVIELLRKMADCAGETTLTLPASWFKSTKWNSWSCGYRQLWRSQGIGGSSSKSSILELKKQAIKPAFAS